MTTTLFLQSELNCPYQFYEKMLTDNPIYWDSINNHWAIYSYKGCKAILTGPSVQIPPVKTEGLNEYALSITGKLARISNEAQHEIARHTVMLLFERMKSVSINEIVKGLIGKDQQELDWVNSVGMKLPISVVLKSFGFKDNDCDFVLFKIKTLIKIMLPAKTPEQVTEINGISTELYCRVENHLLKADFYKPIINDLNEKYGVAKDDVLSFCISNLIGFFIQCYDAGRGILSNTLLQLLNRGDWQIGNIDKEHLQKHVVETLRFNPPVQNTRRIATADIIMENCRIKKGENIFIVLASANRDPMQFANPSMFDIQRSNNSEHLTFGAGGHTCPAKRLSVNLAIDSLFYLFTTYKSIKLLGKTIGYEPMVNLRLPKTIFISIK
ncbi:MAG: cytochrome P450 [Chitinophagaceae bacterium]